tara:strand:+ start:195 stop:437 length:243 start_codon:yes stop_codon:yes gene_type:complete
MSFKGHAFKAGNIEIGKVNPNADLPLLSQEQLIFLLNTLRDTQILGVDMEIAYQTTLTLQNYYTALEKREEERKQRFSKK